MQGAGEVSNAHQQNSVITPLYPTVPDIEYQLRLSSHQGVPLAGNVVREDFQRLLNKMELSHSRTMNHSLPEDTFPDSCVLFDLDELLNIDIATFVAGNNR